MVALFIAMVDDSLILISIAVSGLLFVLTFYGMLGSNEKLVLNPIGIARYYWGSPEALEWQYVESIDFHTIEGKAYADEFFGNKRRVFCPEHIYKELLPIDLIRSYISDLDDWREMKRAGWREGIFRLVRPEP